MPPPELTRSSPGTVSRALARDWLGLPAVRSFVLAGLAPLTVAAGAFPTTYQTTGLAALPAAVLVVAASPAVGVLGAHPRRTTDRRRGE